MADYSPYVDHLRGALEDSLAAQGLQTYPLRNGHCAICQWNATCTDRRHADDHLSTVAGLRRTQARRLEAAGVTTVAQFAATSPLPLVKISPPVLERLHLQARLQVEGRQRGELLHRLLPVEEGRGLCALPEPSAGDIYFDMEGDPIADGGPLEYLFGAITTDADVPEFHEFWATERDQEKRAFEDFVDFVMARWQRFPDLHIYHYADYEKNALRRLAAAHATREDEADRLLRGDRLVDLYAVVRHSLRTSAESLGLKKIERLFMDKREDEITDAGSSIVEFERWTLTGDDGILRAIGRYNEQDCISTWKLRDWLEAQRAEIETSEGVTLSRPQPQDEAPSEAVAASSAEIAALREALCSGVPEQREARSVAQQARWILAHLLEWHRREAKPEWWRYFDHLAMTDDELIADSEALGGLFYEGVVGHIKRSELHRFRFPRDQEHKLHAGRDAVDPASGDRFGSIVEIDNLNGVIEVRRAKPVQAVPTALIEPTSRETGVIVGALQRVAQSVTASGIDGDGPYGAARSLLLRREPASGPLRRRHEDGLAAALRLATTMDGRCLAIQGPPGSGKTYVGARVAVELIRQGRRVGVCAGSHKAIANLLTAICRHAEAEGVPLRAVQRVDADEDRCLGAAVVHAGTPAAAVAALAGADVIAGTAWLFARDDMAEAVDALLVDEAGQMSLANVVAVGGACRNLILQGDPRQLAQPSKGVHPPGVGVSALDHLLGDHATIPEELGLFLERTYRMHPDLCAVVSAAFYEDRLTADASCAQQVINGDGDYGGAGVRYVPVSHIGNRTSSREEADQVVAIVADLLSRTWVDNHGVERPIAIEDILVVAPYNAHVSLLHSVLPPGARVGTVDRFQGQEAAVVIFSMATSSTDDQTRGMDFLFSRNRLDVALSRARALAIVVASPALLDVRCTNEEQVRLAAAFCRIVASANRMPTAAPVH